MGHESLLAQLASAEALLESAADLVLDAAGVLNDAGDTGGVHKLEAIGISVACEMEDLKRRREKLQETGRVANDA
jgi:hypothetical protein